MFGKKAADVFLETSAAFFEMSFHKLFYMLNLGN